MFKNQIAPPVVLNLLIANTVAYVATLVFGYQMVWGNFALFPVESPLFKLWQPLTYMFLHGDFSHMFFNMFALWMFGRTLEIEMGSKRFFIYYIVCGVGAAILQLLVSQIDLMSLIPYSQAWEDYVCMPTMGASGAVYGLLLAFGMLYPNATIYLLIPPIPLKAKWFVVIYGLLELGLIFLMPGDGIAHFAHLGGMLWGWMLLMWWKYRPRR